MNSNEMKLSRLQIPTWNWLRVNDTAVEMDFNGLPEYTQNPVMEQSEFVKIQDSSVSGGADVSGISGEIAAYVSESCNYSIAVEIPDGAVVEEPIVLDFNFAEGDNRLVSHISITAGEKSRATVIIKRRCDEAIRAANWSIVSLNAGNGADITLIKPQTLSEHSLNVEAVQADVEEGAYVNVVAAELGSKQSVATCDIKLLGEGARADLDCIYLGDGERELDLNYRLELAGRQSEGEITIKGALAGNAKKTAKCTLDFIKGASGSKGGEDESVMALSPKAINISSPLLLCGEDDVEGSHAVSTGKPDEGMMFYLMSRGLSEKDAKRLIVEASFAPVLNKIDDDELRGEIMTRIKEIVHDGI